ncbi:MAG: response regulator transcription factor [Planctomycetia bacterium]|nr:response regulator transcription factor [Planctomycetia bacterium]
MFPDSQPISDGLFLSKMKANLTMNKVRVLIVDDHAVLRSGLRLLINAQPDLEVVGEAGTVVEAIRLIDEMRPDVISLDLSLTGGSGLALLEAIRGRQMNCKVVVLTMHDDPGYFHTAMQAGAVGYIAKTAADTELLTALRAAASGRTFVSLSADLASSALGLDSDLTRREARLSERENQVLKGVAAGHTNKEISGQLDLSVKTIETYRSRLLTKLGLKTRPELVQYALEQGLLKKP